MKSQRWRAVTLATAAATGTMLAFAPIASTAACSSTSTGISSCTSSQESLVANEGVGVLLVLAVPALLASVSVVKRTPRSTLVAAGALTLATLLGMASVGIFFIPTVVFAWIAVGSSGQVDRNLQPNGSSAPS